MSKTTQQIAEDCGLDTNAVHLLGLALKTPDSDTDETAKLGAIIGALYRRIERLEDWKTEAISVTPPMQEIGAALGLPLGVSIHDKILPGIVGMKETIRVLECNLAEAGGLA